jgi:RNA polymerase sigma-70 factor (ECF subfamily)
MSIERPSRELNSTPEEAFVRLFGANRERLFAYIVNMVPHWDDAEEVLQRTSIVLRRKFGQFDMTRDFAKWAYGVAYFEVLRYLKQQKRWRRTLSDAVLEKLTRDWITRSDLLEHRRQALDDCMAKLAQTDRRIIEHYYFQGRKTAADVAEELGRPVNTILKALIRIRKSLRLCIDRALAPEDRE